MLLKNKQQAKNIKRTNKQVKFKLIKLKIGLTSVLFGLSLMTMSVNAYANSININGNNTDISNEITADSNHTDTVNKGDYSSSSSNSTNQQLQTVQTSHPNNIENGNQQISVEHHSYTVNGVLYNTDKNDLINNDNQFKVANNMGTINISGDFDGISKNDFKAVNIKINLGDDNLIDTWAKIKWQGNSTQWWPKKSYRLKLFKDKLLSDKYKLELPGSGFKTNSFNLKANFNDPTAGANIVNSDLFKQITQSRQDLTSSIVSKMPNYGQIVGIPVELFINGLDQGIYTLNTYHEDKLFDLNDKKEDNIALDGAGLSDATSFTRPIEVSDINDSDGFSIRSPQKADQSVCNRLNELYQLANASDDQLYTLLENKYLDVPSAIDYLAFSFAINNDDGLRKNITYISKNNSKWIIMPYDLDSSWNIGWDGFLRPINVNFESTLKKSGNQLLWNIYIHHKNDVVKRYKNLRQSVLSSENVITSFNNWMQRIGFQNYQNNGKLWSKLDYLDFRHLETMNPVDLFKAINQRLVFVDNEFGFSMPSKVVTLVENNTKVRNIISILPDGNKIFKKQEVKFSRLLSFDLDNDQYTKIGNWNTGSSLFENYKIPQEAGLHSTLNGKKIENIPETSVTISNPEVTNIQIVYVKDGEKNGWVRQEGSYAFYHHNQLTRGVNYVQLDSLTRPGKKDWYLMKNGIVQSGIQNWMGSLYYFDPVTYLRVDNDYVQSQWGSYYLVGKDGIVQDGVQKWMGTYYYFDPITHLRVDNNYVQSQWGLWYMFGNDGKIVTGPYQWQGSMYYFDPSSYLVVTNDYRVPEGQNAGYLLGYDGRALTGVQQ